MWYEILSAIAQVVIAIGILLLPIELLGKHLKKEKDVTKDEIQELPDVSSFTIPEDDEKDNEDNTGVSDMLYEANITERFNNIGLSVYYSNYTNSEVPVEGIFYSNYAIEIMQHTNSVSFKSLSEWENSHESGIRYVFRVSYKGHYYLVWGNNREDAYLNLLEFAILISR